jgi:hypothetical protein
LAGVGFDVKAFSIQQSALSIQPATRLVIAKIGNRVIEIPPALNSPITRFWQLPISSWLNANC